jgi:hypothetical protein
LDRDPTQSRGLEASVERLLRRFDLLDQELLAFPTRRVTKETHSLAFPTRRVTKDSEISTHNPTVRAHNLGLVRDIFRFEDHFARFERTKHDLVETSAPFDETNPSSD